MSPDASDDEEERRGKGAEEELPDGHERIPAEVAAQLQEVAGFGKKELFERRGALTTRGLAHLLEPGDEVVEVLEDHARIRRRDGTIQTFWNLDRLPPWLSRVEGGSDEG